MEFNKAYDRQDFVRFLRNNFLPEDFVPSEEHIEFQTQTTYSTQAVKLGTCESLDLTVFEIRHTSKHDARVSLSKEAFRLLADELEDRALVAFVPEDCNATYRFSFIEIKLSDDENSSRINRSYSNPRRYSYLLGEGISYYTPNKYLNEKGRVVNYEDLLKRFSVEVLTKDFYKELCIWYAWAIKIIKFPNKLNDPSDDTKYNNESAIRLITRLIFVWFLKQRHLIPEEFFDEQYIADNLIDGFNPNVKEDLFTKSYESKYYKAILQNLFFAMLNCPITETGKTLLTRRFRNGRSDYDNNKLMRYKDYFMNPQLFIDIANKTVPFLNGGLFDCLDDKDNEVYYDGFSDREAVRTALVVPDFLFFGESVGKDLDLSGWFGDPKMKKVDAQGILLILKRYNFTVEENTPFDKDVSLDPELLGKVFENLLAAYNPETQTTARKQTGSFYTPREIVQYMVDESLIAHLKRTVGDNLEAEYRKLLQYTDDPFNLNPEQCHAVMQSLYNCKILDPACGSGAFPMGVLQQMVHILQRIDPDNSHWRTMMLDYAVGETKEAFRKELSEERKDLLKDIERSFDENINRPDYARKLYLIENCIYGVDIQPIAIQISKLRFFISLVVDQKTNNNPADNFGIRPLPNLEAKFVAANTLIGLQKTDASLFDTEEVRRKEAEMKEARHKIFSAKTVKTKRKYRQRMVAVRQELSALLEQSGAVDNKGAAQLNAWDMFDQNASSPFFDPEWMFGVKDGFDIVIGNPPYGAKLSEHEKNFIKTYYFHQDYQYDSYMLFIERGIGLTSNSVLTYIIPNTWLTNITSKSIRKLIFDKTTISQIVHFKDYVFGAIVNTEIICTRTSIPHNNYIGITIDSKTQGIQKKKNCNQEVFQLKKGAPISLFIEASYNSIIDKISILPKLSDFCKITQGTKPFQTGKGTPKQTKEIVKEKPYVSISYRDGFRPLLRGSLMDKYEIRWDNNYYIKYGIWLAEPRESANYDANEKIIIRQTGDSVIATIDTMKFIVRDNLYTCLPIMHSISLYTILGILNSQFINWLYKKIINPEEGEALAQVKKAHLVQIPIPSVNNKILDKLVNKVLYEKQMHNDCGTLLINIDTLVYHLYRLTYEEVLIVDPNTPITEEEYNNERYTNE